MTSWYSIARGAARTAVLAVGAGLLSFSAGLAGANDAGTTPPAPVAPRKPMDDACTPVKKDVDVEMKVIHARNTGKFIDHRVRSIQENLKKLPFNFQSYRLVKEEKITLPPSVERRVKMPFHLSVLMNYGGLGQKSGNICLQVQIGQKQAVAVKLANGGTFLQGVTLKNGQSYILAITAKTKEPARP